MKLKIDCWWTDSYSITNRLIKQFVTNNTMLNNIEFVYDDTFDYIVIFGRPSSILKNINPDNVLCFTMEPLWSSNNTLNLHEISNNIIVHDKRGYIENDSYIENLTYMLYGGHGELNFSDPNYEWTYENITNMRYNKTKNISTIVRNSYETHYKYETDFYKTIYEERVKIIEKIIDNNCNVDIYGRYWNENNKNIKGEIWNKMLGLNDYKFSISSENTIQKNYITEKFWDTILCETIPIYFGCNNFSENIFDLDYFDFTNIINDYNEIIYRINYIDKNSILLYNKFLPIIKNLKNEYFFNKKYNIFLKILEYIQK